MNTSTIRIRCFRRWSGTPTTNGYCQICKLMRRNMQHVNDVYMVKFESESGFCVKTANTIDRVKGSNTIRKKKTNYKNLRAIPLIWPVGIRIYILRI
jgi:hypothetical protein